MRALSTVLAFAGKEMRQVLRQPKLMAVLILGPFLILGLFAAGFQATPPPLRTLVVLPEGSELESSMPQIAEQIGSEIELVGTLGDTGEARQRLLDGEVDLVVEAPADAATTVRNDEQATVVVYHNRGMVVSLSRLADGVRQIAYLSPATAGTTALQDVMFLGNEPNALALAVLGAYVVVSFGIAYMWLRRRQVA